MESQIKTFLHFLNILPLRIENIGIDNKTINTDIIELDENILTELRKI